MREQVAGPWFKFWVARWRTSEAVVLMSAAQRGLYLEALLHQFEGGRVPVEREEVCRRALGHLADDWERDWPAVAEQFPGGVNELMAEARQDACARVAKAAAAGQASGHARRATLTRNASSNGSSSTSSNGSSEAPAAAQRTLVRTEERRGEEKREEKKTPPPGGAGGAEAPSPAGAGSPRAKAPAEKALDLEAWLEVRPAFATERFRKAWAAYVEHRGRGPARSRLTLRAAELALSKLEPLGHEGAAACLEQSVMNGWQGVFPERQNGHARGVPPPDDGRQEAWDQAIAERAARRARWTTR